MEKNIVKVTKGFSPSEGVPYFSVYLNDNLQKVFSYKSNEPEESIWNEEKNKKLAIELAKQLENFTQEEPEIIYTNKSNQ